MGNIGNEPILEKKKKSRNLNDKPVFGKHYQNVPTSYDNTELYKKPMHEKVA